MLQSPIKLNNWISNKDKYIFYANILSILESGFTFAYLSVDCIELEMVIDSIKQK